MVESLNKKLKDVLNLHIDRNELLKDSRYSEFATSDTQMVKDLQEIYSKNLIKEMTKVMTSAGKKNG